MTIFLRCLGFGDLGEVAIEFQLRDEADIMNCYVGYKEKNQRTPKAEILPWLFPLQSSVQPLLPQIALYFNSITH